MKPNLKHAAGKGKEVATWFCTRPAVIFHSHFLRSELQPRKPDWAAHKTWKCVIITYIYGWCIISALSACLWSPNVCRPNHTARPLHAFSSRLCMHRTMLCAIIELCSCQSVASFLFGQKSKATQEQGEVTNQPGAAVLVCCCPHLFISWLYTPPTPKGLLPGNVPAKWQNTSLKS